jgi:NAD(P)-dependent dehydrogenase (short-subunit alcohol dehydrogenase family)
MRSPTSNASARYAGDFVPIELDLTDPASVDAAANSILKVCGSPSLLIHNAGVAVEGGFEDTPAAEWSRVFATNLIGPVELTRRLLPAMRQSGAGSIIVVSSEAAITGMPGVSAYGASKAALERWAESLAAEVARFGITVAIVRAGTFKTDILEKSPRHESPDGPYRDMYRSLDDIATRVTHFARPPEKFARRLAKLAESPTGFRIRPIGVDAWALQWASRALTHRQLHKLVRRLAGSANEWPSRGHFGDSTPGGPQQPAGRLTPVMNRPSSQRLT